MKIKFLVMAALLSIGATLPAAPTGLDAVGQLKAIEAKDKTGFSFTQLENGVQVSVNGITKNVIFYGPKTVRVNANLGKTHTTQASIVVVGKPAKVSFKVKDTDGALEITSDKLNIVVDKKTGALTFKGADGKEFTKERTDNPAEIKEITISNAPTYDVKQNFTLADDESLYGLGQYNTPYMDYRGKNVLMVQTNIGIVVPMLVSTKRYGIMWDIYSKATFKDDAEGAHYWAESAPAGVDYYFFGGDTLDDVIASYRQLTGPAPMFSREVFGFFMSKERYQTQKRIVEVVQDFRKNEFPLDYIVQDWQYWGSDKDGTWSGMIWNKERYPDPAGMAKSIHDAHAKLLISIWPSIGNDTDLAKELDEKNLRFKPLHWISKQARIYDAFSAEGRAIYFKHIKKGLLDIGVDGLWMDGTEVEVGGACHDAGGVERDIKNLGNNAMGDFTRYLNPYTLMTTKGTYEGQRAINNKRVFTLTRSAWTGSQRYAAVSWSGDTTAGWNTLRNQISGGVNVAMSGQPYWTQDTGGFFVGSFTGGDKNPEWRELFARWNQFGVFNPIYRVHGCGAEREPYIFKTTDPEVYKSLLDSAHLRYRLLPYLYSMGWMSTNQGYTMMRGLPMDFPDDLKVRKTDDAYTFGPAFLVHPVTRAMYRSKDKVPAATIPTEALQTADGKPGITIEYFEGKNFEKSVSKMVDPKVDYNWPGPPLVKLPEGLTSTENFSARLEGFIVAPEDGEYEISVGGDDGFRMWLDGKKVADDWKDEAVRYKDAKVTLTKGQKLPVKIEYYQGGLDRALNLAWRTPGDQKKFASGAKELNNTVETYLPTGANWYDFWTNEQMEGGKTVKKDCPLDILPLYVRAGSIVPMGPIMQYSTEKLDAPYEIRIYPGANAKFTIYEDDNATYNYEKGEYATYDLTWDDAAKKLTVGARKGKFAEMIASRKLNVVLAAPNQNAGIADATSAKTVTYEGKQVEVKF